jgi:hypothetical protein
MSTFLKLICETILKTTRLIFNLTVRIRGYITQINQGLEKQRPDTEKRKLQRFYL